MTRKLTRTNVVYWTPAVVGALVGMMMFREPIAIRVIYSLLFGLLLQLVGTFLLFLLSNFVCWLAGLTPVSFPLDSKSPHLTAALLLAVLVYGLGIQWKANQARTMARCLKDKTAIDAVGPHPTAEEFVQYCVYEYGHSRSLSSDE